MSLIIQNEIASEFLTDKEVIELTGFEQRGKQIDWLINRQWAFSVSGKNEIKISRWYSRIKMSGININNDIHVSGGDQLPNFNKAS
ncbi:MAG TPA: DUF4224 domain-containing protein [Methylophaga aminisulfidivorans]|uniref:DUF4224 domain-containing protein n=2 Tax=root TaxID=1 RepID=A0A7C1ZNQ4_9GAMM|nr:DUF4224 domain-containing protein [Methylophaga aminisulfidivorans]